VHNYKILVRGSRRGNTAQALVQWQHPVASGDSPDLLNQAMRPTMYCRICMVINIFVVCLLPQPYKTQQRHTQPTLWKEVAHALKWLYPSNTCHHEGKRHHHGGDVSG